MQSIPRIGVWITVGGVGHTIVGRAGCWGTHSTQAGCRLVLTFIDDKVALKVARCGPWSTQGKVAWADGKLRIPWDPVGKGWLDGEITNNLPYGLILEAWGSSESLAPSAIISAIERERIKNKYQPSGSIIRSFNL